ncbi:hypothetical protein V6N12_041624 [Hibiscus sabdariffa]|uniref:Uncharacterized protein n=1 Tax=Hibiscus sabdariffa TaxID=183260 RepID=A0ABR2AZE8_9ROSI
MQPQHNSIKTPIFLRGKPLKIKGKNHGTLSDQKLHYNQSFNYKITISNLQQAFNSNKANNKTEEGEHQYNDENEAGYQQGGSDGALAGGDTAAAEIDGDGYREQA